jgi:probable poly-beta-1,6-N-acetyl-D-glucosamine export protein
MANKRLVQFDFLRFLAIIGVVVIHSTSQYLSSPQSGKSDQYWALLSINQASRFCVPAFILISGFFSTWQKEEVASSEKQNSRITLRRTFSRLIIPYLFWSFLFILISNLIGGSHDSFFSLAWKLISGGAFWGGYFIIVLLQLSLLNLLIFRNNLVLKWLVIISVISLLITEAIYYYGIWGGLSPLARIFRAGFVYYRALFIPWLPFYLIGMYLGLHYHQTLPILKQYWRVSTLAMFLLLIMALIETKIILQRTNSTAYAVEYFRISTIIFSLAVCLSIIGKIPDNMSLHPTIKRIADGSYGIFYANDRLILIFLGVFPFLKNYTLAGNLFLTSTAILIPLCLYIIVIHCAPKWARLISYGEK